jgi:hypothetical protein
VKIIGGPYALDGEDFGVFGHFFPGRYAGSRDLAVENDVTGTALPLTASKLGSRKMKLFPDDIDELFIGRGDDTVRDTIDDNGFDAILLFHFF